MKEITIEEMKEINAGAECAAGYSCLGGQCWYKWIAPYGGEIWVTDWSSCG